MWNERFSEPGYAYGTGGPRSLDLLFDLTELCAEISGLKLDMARDLDRDLNEGRYHNGTAAVIQILGVKVPSSQP